MNTPLRIASNAAIALGFLSSGAHADWQGTKWGMTRNEANRAFNAKKSSIADVFRYTTGNMKFDAELSYDRTGHLAAVLLFNDDPSTCPFVVDAYRRTYGKPSKTDVSKPSDTERTGAFFGKWIWEDSHQGNAITLRYTDWEDGKYNCRVEYAPLPQPAKGGL